MQIPLDAIKRESYPQVKPIGEKERTGIHEINLWKASLSNKTRMEFYHEMHLMFSAGIDMRLSLEVFVEEFAGNKQKKIFSEIKNQVIEGMPLSDALEKSGVFTSYEYQSVRIGEESGNLKEVLYQLKEYFSNKIDQRRQLIGALAYPVLVLVTSIGAVAFMLQVVVPMFKDVFKRFGNELPALTKAIIYFSEGASEHFISVLVVILTTSALCFLLKENDKFRMLTSRLALSIPFFGSIIHSSQLSKLSSAMYLLISAHHPLDKSLGLIRKMVRFRPIEISLEEAESDLLKGMSLSESFAKHKIYSRKMVTMLRMAEEVNKLDVIFAQLRDQYNEEIRFKSSLLSNVLEPILIIFIGVMVGFILIAMYLPLFELSTNLG